MNSLRTLDHAPPAEFASDTKHAHNCGSLARLCCHAEQRVKDL